MSVLVVTPSACLSCGACCAFFRVSFYWGEAQSAGGIVPDNLTHKVNNVYSCMQGTESKPSRCTALLGTVGEQVRCTIYSDRPSPCREFSCHNEVAEGNDDCNKARAHHGLPPLPAFVPDIFDPPVKFPEII